MNVYSYCHAEYTDIKSKVLTGQTAIYSSVLVIQCDDLLNLSVGRCQIDLGQLCEVLCELRVALQSSSRYLRAGTKTQGGD